jgi:3-hydroxyisobutyrate dehydrogenase-like beta-hydroxyacid dehydrogenase
MGSAMSANLVKAGHRVVGFDLLPARRRALARAGGEPVDQIGAVVAQARLIICSLPSADALLEVARTVVASPLPPGGSHRPRVFVETSTLPIAVKEQARDLLGDQGHILLDCPLSGTGAQARTRDLVVYGSGDEKAYRSVVPVLEGFSRANYYVGPFGSGSKMKFVANLLVAIHNVAGAEALVLAMKGGLDPAMAYTVLSDSAGASRMFQVRGPMMVANDYLSDVTMKLSVWQKDMNVIADFAKSVGCPTPMFTATIPLYLSATATDPLQDTGGVCGVLEKLADYRRPRRRKR